MARDGQETKRYEHETEKEKNPKIIGRKRTKLNEALPPWHGARCSFLYG